MPDQCSCRGYLVRSAGISEGGQDVGVMKGAADEGFRGGGQVWGQWGVCDLRCSTTTSVGNKSSRAKILRKRGNERRAAELKPVGIGGWAGGGGGEGGGGGGRWVRLKSGLYWSNAEQDQHKLGEATMLLALVATAGILWKDRCCATEAKSNR